MSGNIKCPKCGFADEAEMTPQQLVTQAEKMGYALIPLVPSDDSHNAFNNAILKYNDQGCVWGFPFRDGYKALIKAVKL